MSGTGTVLLGVIAAATAAMAVGQVVIAVIVLRLSRRIHEISTRFEQDVRPILGHVQSVSADAVRTAALAAAQVERADRLMASLAERVDATAAAVQHLFLTPAREGRAVLSAVLAAVAAFRGIRRAARPPSARGDEGDPLFIG